MAKPEQPTLFFFFIDGCAHCARVRPIVRAFRDANPDVKVVALDLNMTEWKARNWEPMGAPTLVALSTNGKWAKLEGDFDEGEFYGFVAAHLR